MKSGSYVIYKQMYVEMMCADMLRNYNIIFDVLY